MKKTILLIASILLCMSCSQDDSGSGSPSPAFLDFQEITGSWYYNKVIKEDGSIEDYVHSCTTNKDRIEFYNIKSAREYHYYTNCEYYYSVICTNFILDGFKVVDCSDKLSGTYTHTGNTLRIDYDEVEYIGQVGNNFINVKGLILTRE